MIEVVFVILTSLITLLGAPLLYVFKYGRRSALRWMLFQLGVIVVIFILTAAIFGILSSLTPTYPPYYAI